MKSKANYFATFVSGLGTVVVSILIGLISAPVALNYWKPERYALWALLQTIVTYLNITNLGIGQAANTLIGKNASFAVKKKILKRSAIMLFIAMALMIIFVIFISIGDSQWYLILGKIPEGLLGEAKDACGIIILFFFINLPFTLLTSFLIGCQKAYLENILSVLLMIAGLVGLLLVVNFHLGLAMLALINGLSVCIINCARLVLSLLVWRANKDHGDLETSGGEGDESYSAIAITSLRFFLIWIASTMVWNTDNFVISNVIGLKEIAAYSISFKFFTIMISFLSIINNSILPIMAKEFGRGNWEWIISKYRQVSLITLSAGGLASIGAMALGHDFILVWTGDRGYAGVGVFTFLSIYLYLYSFVNLNSGLVNSFNFTKLTWIIAFGEGAIKLAVSIVGCSLFGIAGVAMGTMAGALLSPFVFTYIVLHRSSGARITFPLRAAISHGAYALLPVLVASIGIQLLVRNASVRITAGVTLILVYCIATYMLWPKDIKLFLRSNILHILPRFSGRSK